jgi:hypothetical protein
MANSKDRQIQRTALTTRLEPAISPFWASVGGVTIDEVMAERARPSK